jgi:hypothetical protein
MLLIIGDRRRKGHGAGHPHMSDRDEECFLFVQRDDVAHYSTFIAGIGQVRDYTVCLIGMGLALSLKLFDHLWCQFDFEWDSRFKRGHERFGLPRIVEHLRPFSSSDSVSQMVVIMDQKSHLALPPKMDFRHVPFAKRRETTEE